MSSPSHISKSPSPDRMSFNRKPKGYLKEGYHYKDLLFSGTYTSGFTKKRNLMNEESERPELGKLKRLSMKELELKAYKQELAKVSFRNKKYIYPTPLRPSMFFYKFLAKMPSDVKEDLKNTDGRLRLYIPDTIVYNDSSREYKTNSFWVYSSIDGFVYRTEAFQDHHVIQKLGNQFNMNELVAIQKTPSSHGNYSRLLSTNELVSTIREISSGANDTCAIQKFVKCHGPKPFFCRGVWRRHKPSLSYMITNKNSFYEKNVEDEGKKYIVNLEETCSCTIILSKERNNNIEILQYIQNIARFLECHAKIQFQELVADFIKDESGTWWFIGIKAFMLQKDNPYLGDFCELRPSFDDDMKGSSFKIDKNFEKEKVCKFCQIGYNAGMLNHQMTMKMILQTDIHLRHLGHNMDWLDHEDYTHYDHTSLYQIHNVCKTCYQIYQQIEELKALELKFAKALGIPVTFDPAQQPIAGGDSAQIRFDDFDQPSQTKKKPKRGFSTYDLNGQNMYQEEHPAEKPQEAVDPHTFLKLPELFIYRVLVIFHEITELPQNILNKKNFAISFQLFGQYHKIKLDHSKTLPYGIPLIPINKLRLFYFFCESSQKFEQFILRNNKLDMKILCDNKSLATGRFDLTDFHTTLVTKREFNSMFSGHKATCFLKFSMGIKKRKKKMDVSRIPLKAYDQIYIPQENFYACQKLPSEWLDMIPNVTEYKRKLKKLVQQRIQDKPFTTNDSPFPTKSTSVFSKTQGTASYKMETFPTSDRLTATSKLESELKNIKEDEGGKKKRKKKSSKKYKIGTKHKAIKRAISFKNIETKFNKWAVSSTSSIKVPPALMNDPQIPPNVFEKDSDRSRPALTGSIRETPRDITQSSNVEKSATKARILYGAGD